VERLELSPEGITTTAKRHPDKFRSLLVSYAGKQKAAGLLDSYITKSFNGLKAWLEFNHVAFREFPKLKPFKGASLAKERVPTPEELGRVLERLSLRGRTGALLMAHSGLRPGVLGSYGGQDGLTLAALPDLRLSPTPMFKQIPFTILVPAELSKTRVSYTTFGTEQLAQTLASYLGERLDMGEKLSSKSPLIGAAPSRGIAKVSRAQAKFGQGYLTTKAVVEEIREGLRAVVPEDVTWRPYVLRGYCSTRLLVAEGHGKITRDLREAILGHDGGVAARYNVGKPWGRELLEEARAAYRRAETYLFTVQNRAGEDVFAEMRRGLLLALEVPEEEVRAMVLENMTNEKFHELVARMRVGAPPVAAHGATTTTSAPRQNQKIVAEEDVDQWVEQGWTVFTTLGGGKRVVLNPMWQLCFKSARLCQNG
jgi:integrase